MNGPVFDSSIPHSAVRLMSRFPRVLKVRALDQSIEAVIRRVQALETYADRVATAESVFTAEKFMASNHKYEDLLSLTHDEASVPILTEQAANSSAALSVSPRAALDAGRALTV